MEFMHFRHNLYIKLQVKHLTELFSHAFKYFPGLNSE